MFLFGHVCSYLLGIYQGVEFDEPFGCSLFNVLRKAKLFSTVAHLNISTTMYESFNFSISSLAVLLFDHSHLIGGEVVSHYSFDLHFLDG